MDELGAGPVLYGCMRIGGGAKAPGPGERDTAFAALDTALQCGARLFDHADIYRQGRSEALFGAWHKSRGLARQDFLVQSKCGIRLGEGGRPDVYDFSKDHILGAVEGSLRRLQVDYLDSLLLHRPDPLGEPEEVASAVSELKRRGWIKAVGVSNFSPAQIRLYQSVLDEPIRVNQVELSLRHAGLIEAGVQVNRAAAPAEVGAEVLVDFCREKGIDVQAWAPLARGASPGDRLDEEVRDIASDHGVEPEAISIAWLLRHPARLRPIVGSTRPARIRAALKAAEVQLSREEWYRLFNAARSGDLP